MTEKEPKHCENCEEILHGEFCHTCGQKDIDIKFTFWKLFGFLVKEYVNWDNKVFRTFKALFFKPGHLSKEYMQGKRSLYMNPLRLYFFTRAYRQ